MFWPWKKQHVLDYRAIVETAVLYRTSLGYRFPPSFIRHAVTVAWAAHPDGKEAVIDELEKCFAAAEAVQERK